MQVTSILIQTLWLWQVLDVVQHLRNCFSLTTGFHWFLHHTLMQTASFGGFLRDSWLEGRKFSLNGGMHLLVLENLAPVGAVWLLLGKHGIYSFEALIHNIFDIVPPPAVPNPDNGAGVTTPIIEYKPTQFTPNALWPQISSNHNSTTTGPDHHSTVETTADMSPYDGAKAAGCCGNNITRWYLALDLIHTYNLQASSCWRTWNSSWSRRSLKFYNCVCW